MGGMSPSTPYSKTLQQNHGPEMNSNLQRCSRPGRFCNLVCYVFARLDRLQNQNSFELHCRFSGNKQPKIMVQVHPIFRLHICHQFNSLLGMTSCASKSRENVMVKKSRTSASETRRMSSLLSSAQNCHIFICC